MRLASSSEKSMLGAPWPFWSLFAEGNFLNVSGTERYDGGEMKRLLVSNALLPLDEELFGTEEGVPSEGGVEGAGDGRWKPSWRERICGL